MVFGRCNSKVSSTKSKYKMVRMDEKLHKELSQMGSVGESFSDLIRKMMDFYKIHHKEKGVSK